MPINFTRIAVLLMFAASPVWAGMWGLGSFENDDALDWVSNELEASAPRAVQSAIAGVLGAKRDLNVTQGSYLVAACELLAAARGKPSPGLPPEVVRAAKALAGKRVEPFLKDAIKALDKVVTSPGSELRGLNEEAGSLAAWKKLMDDLKARVGPPSDAPTREI